MSRPAHERLLGPVLEVGAIAAYGYWGWALHGGAARWAWALGGLIMAAAVWDLFRVPGDSTLPPTVAVPGWGRLTLEAAFFTGAACSLVAAGVPELGVCLVILVCIHYTLTFRRVVWLLREGAGESEF